MIILTAGHTGAHTGAQCAETHFDEGAENIWLRNRIAEILTNKYGLAVLLDNDTASLQLLIQSINALPCRDARLERPNEQSESQCRDTRLERPMTRKGQNPTSTASPQSVQICRATSCAARERIEEKEELKSESSVQSVGENSNPDGTRSVNSVRSVNQRSLSPWRENSVSDKNNSVSETTFLIDLHFNAHSNPNARGTEVIVANDATTLELRFASRLAHTTSDALDIPLRCIKSESETPHHRLAMLHLTPQSIILEVCFCTSPEDVEAYRKNREKLAAELAWAIAELLPSVVSTDNRQRMSQNVNYKQNLNPDGTVDR